MDAKMICDTCGFVSAGDAPRLHMHTIFDRLNRGGTRYTQDELDAAVATAVAAEREACALACEDAEVVTYGGYYGGDDGNKTLSNAAKAIRARSEK